MKKTLKVIPLGGLGQIGMNMMVLQCGKEAVIIDCGVMFSDHHLPGIDLILPDFSYVLDKQLDVHAILLTHGHEDHIGAVPYLLRKRPMPVYGSRFTLALVKERLKEHSLGKVELKRIKEGENVSLGCFDVEFIRMSHSIADALALAIGTPEGLVIHTGDFKIDPNPSDGRTTDLDRFKQLGDEGVFLLMSDSTNVEIPGPSVSESTVRSGIEELMNQAKGWVILASFASHIPRLKQVIEISLATKRKLLLAGRSMIQNVGIARELGYLTFPDDLLIEAEDVRRLPRNKVCILSTGTQGEPRSALARMALGEHKELEIKMGDVVILSSRFIPGNERAIYATVNHLYRRGAEVFTTKGADVHVSGHGYHDDLQKMIQLTKPKYFVPVHGEYRHLVKHVQLAQSEGIPSHSTLLLEDGQVAEFSKDVGRITRTLELHRSVVDGRELGDIGSSVLRDRRQLSGAGLVVVVVILDSHSGELVRKPELFSKGLAFEGRADDLLEEARSIVEGQIEEFGPEARTDPDAVQEEIRVAVRRFFKNELDRKPVVIPIVLEV